MKTLLQIILLIIVTGIVNAVLFLTLGGFLLFTYFIYRVGPFGIYVVIFLLACSFFSYAIIKALIQRIAFFHSTNLTNSRAILIIIGGLLIGGSVIYVRNEVPRSAQRLKRQEEQSATKHFIQSIPSTMTVENAVFSVKENFENVPDGINEYRFTIEIPININASFTRSQIAYALETHFLSQEQKYSFPQIEGCYVGSMSYRGLDTGNLDEHQNLSGSYMLRYSYDFSRNPKFVNYQNCSKDHAQALKGENIVFQTQKGIILKAFTVDVIQIH